MSETILYKCISLKEFKERFLFYIRLNVEFEIKLNGDAVATNHFIGKYQSDILSGKKYPHMIYMYPTSVNNWSESEIDRVISFVKDNQFVGTY